MRTLAWAIIIGYTLLLTASLANRAVSTHRWYGPTTAVLWFAVMALAIGTVT